ncbi:hypothetical protein HKD21_05825 [Gluconobacter cerevisiae]|uniref:Uncharacterized protein n=1 Tax=Gluconobacter cerevisiae TaxID=1379734 RepID=A0ABR9YDZ2_9PROT|nr:hypothetical protein [Gluconobacter cerevisiae]MBF0876365.1 hypothetical protein [Gluconobacter cerevisiae]
MITGTGQDWFDKLLLRYHEAMKPFPHFLVIFVWVMGLSLGASLVTPAASWAHGSPQPVESSLAHHDKKTRSSQVAVCYRMASGVIVLAQMPNNTHRLGRGGGFAPIGEAVFRSSNRPHACTPTHGRRG